MNICEKYASLGNVKIIHKDKNEGVECARWSGYQVSIGEYIAYVDSDDWLKKGILLKMLNKIEETGSDYVECGFYRCMGRHIKYKRKCRPTVTGLIQLPELLDKYYISFFWGEYFKCQNVW